MSLAQLLALFLSFTLVACQAYRQTPESAISYTRDDLNRGGVVLAPLSFVDAKLDPGPAELVAYDTILGNTLHRKWPTTPLLTSGEIAKVLDADTVEDWRRQLNAEPSAEPSPSSAAVLGKLKAKAQPYPKQLLLPTLIQNMVSCSQRDPLVTTQNPNPQGFRHYCQRIVKMRFRILSASDGEILWNGLIYATQENVQDEKEAEGDKPITVEAPSTQNLIRECFLNFAKQFGERS